MRMSLLRSVLLIVAVMLGATAASALTIFKNFGAPEIDPGMAVGALTLLTGSIAVIRARRQK